MGPVALFDKSFLQSLSVDESVWFDHFFYPNICPLFFVETLADLSKSNLRSDRTAEDEVRIIANKTPELSGGPCVYHQSLCIGDLMGHRAPMTGQIPLGNARSVQAADGRKGTVYDESLEQEALRRWRDAAFEDVERLFARGWRQMLASLDLAAVAEGMRKLGINPQNCKSLDQARDIATGLLHSRDKPFDQMALLFLFVQIPRDMMQPILARWKIDQYRPLAAYAPYAAHILSVELFFQIALAANLISTERPSNRVDIAYLFYLPFCQVFTSSDALHRRCAPLFLRSDQSFVWGPDLKAELRRLNAHFARLPESVRESGIMRFASLPVGGSGDLMMRLWDKHFPGWGNKENLVEKLKPEKNAEVAKEIRGLIDAPTVHPAPDDPEFADTKHVAIQRRIRKLKGTWWQLPKDLKAEPEPPQPAANG